MKNNIMRKRIISSLILISQEIDWNMSIPKLALFFSYFYALVILKPKSDRKKQFNISDYINEDTFLCQNLLDASILFKDTVNKNGDQTIQQVFSILKEIEITTGEVDNTVGWLYQALKQDLEKKAFKEIRESQQKKLQGKDLLFTTQFFTDEYMVKFMVDTCLKDAPGYSVENVVFIDPAMGGGNFLSYSFCELFKWYSNNSELEGSDIANIIIQNQLVGYDLDSEIVKIAKLSLCINVASCTGLIELSPIRYFSGTDTDVFGFMKESIISDTIDGETFEDVITRLKNSCVKIEYITNPPFMGKRDMDPKLKDYLIERYPNSKGDLCFSFMEKIMELLRTHDRMSTVSQNGWLNLSSMQQFRKNILDNLYLQYCIDMGSNAFAAINGEKANITLSRILCDKNHESTRFYKLKGLTLSDKIDYLIGQEDIDNVEYVVDQHVFLNNESYEFTYELVNSFDLLCKFEAYSQYAVPMQGTSTGNNKAFVKFAWDPITNGPEWKIVSKGGGFSKWRGLNIYKVKWGKNGELVANNPGSAIRNLKEMPFTELVYSDTGTLGLNVRILLTDQIFIASGPGIRIKGGDRYCHMAYLNSRIATYLLKVMNPKFTISAGYISKLPVKQEILTNKTISNLCRSIVTIKEKYLSTKLPNLEYQADDFSKIIDLDTYIDNLIMHDIENHKERYILECDINRMIVDLFNFSKEYKAKFLKLIEIEPTENNSNYTLPYLDKAMTSILSHACNTISRRLKNSIFGSENFLEILSCDLNLSIESLVNIIYNNIREFKNLRTLYKRDLIHKMILSVCGIKCITPVRVECKISDINTRLRETYPQLYQALSIDNNLLMNIINKVHSKVFMNNPIIIAS